MYHKQAEPEYPEMCEGYKRRFNRHFKHFFEVFKEKDFLRGHKLFFRQM